MTPLDEALEALAPADEWTPDWSDVVARSVQTSTPVEAVTASLDTRKRRLGSHRLRLALGIAAALLAISVPAVALSASVRGWLGFGPQPVYAKAQLVVSTPIPGDRVARVWIAPSVSGGDCEFVTISRADVVAVDPATGAMRPPTQMNGGGGCTVGSAHIPPIGLTWSFSRIVKARPGIALIHGHVGKTSTGMRVAVRWHGGGQKLHLANGYFIGVVPMRNPPFHQLPYTVVAYDPDGRAEARSRIPTSFLYDDWKRVEPRLHQYRQAHGCSTKPVWACKSR